MTGGQMKIISFSEETKTIDGNVSGQPESLRRFAERESPSPGRSSHKGIFLGLCNASFNSVLIYLLGNPESVRSGAHKVPVQRPGYRRKNRGVNGGIDLGNCLQKGEKNTTEKNCICAPGVTPGPVRAVSVRLARTQDNDSRDQRYSYEQDEKHEKVQQEMESADQNQEDRKAPTQQYRKDRIATF